MWTVRPYMTMKERMDEADRINRTDRELIALEEARRLLQSCLDTGSLRTDSTRQLYIDVCKFLGKEPK